MGFCEWVFFLGLGELRGKWTYGCASRPDAVEHVGAESDGDDEVFGVSDAHHVTGFVLGEPVGAVVDSVSIIVRYLAIRGKERETEKKGAKGCVYVHFTISGLRLTTTQPTDSHARRIPPRHLLAANLPHLEIQTSLYDTEQVLPVRMLVSGDAAVQPSDGAFHGFLHAGFVRGGGCDDVVELHDYVGADDVLEGDGVFGCE